MVLNQFGQRGFVAGHIAQFPAVFERERRRVGGEIKTDEAQNLWGWVLEFKL